MKKLTKSKKKDVKATSEYTITFQPLLDEGIVLIKQSDAFTTYTKREIDLKDTIAKQGAEGYAHDQDKTVLADSKTYTDGKVGGILDEAKAYADEEDVKVKTYADEQDAKTLTSAKTYSDNKDANVLASAKTYADGINTRLEGIITALTERVTALETELGKKLDDAPSDGKTYGRKDATWTKVEGGATGNSFGEIFVNGAGPITASQPNDAVDFRGTDGIALIPDFVNNVITIKENA